jgi:hypothetical protein
MVASLLMLMPMPMQEEKEKLEGTYRLESF